MLNEKEIPINPAEWQMWKNHPITLKVFEALTDERSMWVDDLVFGRTLEVMGTEVRDTAIAVGVAKGLGFILEGLEMYLLGQWEEAARLRKEAEDMESEG